jgi:hypothetical protein
MLFDARMNPRWCDNPEALRRYLLSQKILNPERLRGCRVRAGWPQKLMSVEEYLKEGNDVEET